MYIYVYVYICVCYIYTFTQIGSEGMPSSTTRSSGSGSRPWLRVCNDAICTLEHVTDAPSMTHAIGSVLCSMWHFAAFR